MAYQQEPESIVWMIRDDGTLLAMTYVREQEICAWTPQETQGKFESICSIPGDGFNEIWAIVARGPDRFVERMVKRLIYTEVEDAEPLFGGVTTRRPYIENQFFVDCGLTYDSEATDVISGLDHLNDREVAILADGVEQPRQTVVDGAITLEQPASVVQVGLAYTAKFKTLNPDLPLRDGTMQGRKNKISEATLRLQNSLGGFIGPDEDTLHALVYEDQDPLAEVQELFTGETKQVIDGDFGLDVGVYLEQSSPFPITILAVLPTVVVGG
jgi:hypothetical protein